MRDIQASERSSEPLDSSDNIGHRASLFLFFLLGALTFTATTHVHVECVWMLLLQ